MTGHCRIRQVSPPDWQALITTISDW
ncbi:MAG: hypothetical protein ACLUIQ_03570 [Dialister invisus]